MAEVWQAQRHTLTVQQRKGGLDNASVKSEAKIGVRRRKSSSQRHRKHRLFSWVSERGKVFISVPPKMGVTFST